LKAKRKKRIKKKSLIALTDNFPARYENLKYLIKRK